MPTLKPTNRPQTSKNRRYERGIGLSDLDSVALYPAQVCYANMPRPLYSPQTAQTFGVHNLHAR